MLCRSTSSQFPPGRWSTPTDKMSGILHSPICCAPRSLLTKVRERGAARQSEACVVTLPTFRTERLILRPRTIADCDDCLAMDRDPDVVRYIPGPWADPAAHEAFVRDRITRRYPDGLGYWCVALHTAPDRFLGLGLGWVPLLSRDAVGPEIEIGLALGADRVGARIRVRGGGRDHAPWIRDGGPQSHHRGNRSGARAIAACRREGRASPAPAEKLLLYEITREGFFS